jgi:hypothetical protein
MHICSVLPFSSPLNILSYPSPSLIDPTLDSPPYICLRYFFC